MTAHLMVPSLDLKIAPPSQVTSFLFYETKSVSKVVIITDSLVMEGLLKNCHHSVEEAAIRAFQAGHDILLLGGKQLQGAKDGFELTVRDIEKIHHALVDAVRSTKSQKNDWINLSIEF